MLRSLAVLVRLQYPWFVLLALAAGASWLWLHQDEYLSFDLHPVALMPPMEAVPAASPVVSDAGSACCGDATVPAKSVHVPPTGAPSHRPGHDLSATSTLLAGAAYFALGGLWFTPLFGRQWDRAVGFQRPARWRPPPAYYLVPLVGCVAVSATVGFLLSRVAAVGMFDALSLGLAVGVGFGLAITSVNALAPNMPRPALYAAVTGSYHALGALLCAAIHFWWRG